MEKKIDSYIVEVIKGFNSITLIVGGGVKTTFTIQDWREVFKMIEDEESLNKEK